MRRYDGIPTARRSRASWWTPSPTPRSGRFPTSAAASTRTLGIEGGIIAPGMEPGRLPISTNEMRAARHATMLPGITDTFLLAQRGFLDCGFIGGAQIDRHGNLNTSAIGRDYWKPTVRLPGSGGANDIYSLCKVVLVLTLHVMLRVVDAADV